MRNYMDIYDPRIVGIKRNEMNIYIYIMVYYHCLSLYHNNFLSRNSGINNDNSLIISSQKSRWRNYPHNTNKYTTVWNPVLHI